MPKGNTTIYDIAKALDISPATVSLALNDDARVNIKTKERVRDAAQAMHYRPNFIARSLVNQKTNIVGVVIPNLFNPLFAVLVKGAEDCLSQRHYDLILGVTDERLEKEQAYLNMLTEQKVDGLFIMPTFTEELDEQLRGFQDKSIPFVISGVDVKDRDYDYVASDSRRGAYLAVEHLIRGGRKHIAFISSAASAHQISDRLDGYRQALEAAGLPFYEKYILVTGRENEDVRAETMAFLRANPEVDGVFVLYDYIALIVMKAIFDLHRRIPEDIAVVGFDNIPTCDLLPVTLTTVETKSYEMGFRSAEILVDKIENPGKPTQKVILEPELIVRQSS